MRPELITLVMRVVKTAPKLPANSMASGNIAFASPVIAFFNPPALIFNAAEEVILRHT